MPKIKHIPIAEIRTEGLQTRVRIDPEVVREYSEAEAERAAVLPPVVAYSNLDGEYWLADGFHRIEVARRAQRKKIAAEVREGGRIDALRVALGANGAHGLRRSNADKMNAVKMAYANRIALGLGEVPSARKVAELVGVSHEFTRNQLSTVDSWRAAQERLGADGKVRGLPPIPARKPTENSDFPPPPTRREVPSAGLPPASRTRDRAREAEGGVPAGAVGHCRTLPDGRAEGGVSGVPAAVPPPPVRRSVAPVPEGPVDDRGTEIPPALIEIWNRRGEVQDVLRLVSQARVAIRDAQNGADPLWTELNASSALAHLDRAYTEIDAAKPWCVCPMCHGIGCRCCKGQGLISQYRFDHAVPSEFKG